MIRMHRLLPSLVPYLNSRTGRIGIILSALNYGQAVVGFFISFYLARQLGPAGFGLYSYGIVVGIIVYTLVNFGAERTLVRDLVQLEDKSQTLVASIALRSFLGLTVLFILIISLPLWVEGNSKKSIVAICALASTFWAVSPAAWFDAQYRMHYHALITFFERLIYALLIYFLVTTSGARGAVSVSLLLLFTRAGSMLFQTYCVREHLHVDLRTLKPTAAWLFSSNFLIVLAAISNLFISHWNQLVLEDKLSSEHLGYYALAFQMIAVVTLLQGQILRIFFPKIATLTARHADPRRAGRAMLGYMTISSGLSFAVVLPLYFSAPLLLKHYFPPSYSASLAPLRLLCLWAVFNGGARIINAFLINLRLEREFFWSSLLGGLIAVGLGMLLIPKFGESGVALALLISHPVSVSAQAIFVAREISHRGRGLPSPS